MDMLNTVTVLNRLSRCKGAQKLERDPRLLEILYKIEAWLANALRDQAQLQGPEAVLPKHLASIATALARLQWKGATAGRLLRMMVQIAPGNCHILGPVTSLTSLGLLLPST
eukprot:gnl/TRDRNA2_/TRDRNA2_147026_c0_seq1.p3 gnl/TRDRNA2_/TRDRNA2_147026_c0~~gnl/TRDRNA2_/TRDRNA2_147026_c0_seq1.p3  ORF type:complete len:112 (-),score=10.42 gnl/TRDRNA2_/TRDRNA2_147026_c0_seq1:49-384(-)